MPRGLALHEAVVIGKGKLEVEGLNLHQEDLDDKVPDELEVPACSQKKQCCLVTGTRPAECAEFLSG